MYTSLSWTYYSLHNAVLALGCGGHPASWPPTPASPCRYPGALRSVLHDTTQRGRARCVPRARRQAKMGGPARAGTERVVRRFSPVDSSRRLTSWRCCCAREGRPTSYRSCTPSSWCPLPRGASTAPRWTRTARLGGTTGWGRCPPLPAGECPTPGRLANTARLTAMQVFYMGRTGFANQL